MVFEQLNFSLTFKIAQDFDVRFQSVLKRTVLAFDLNVRQSQIDHNVDRMF